MLLQLLGVSLANIACLSSATPLRASSLSVGDVLLPRNDFELGGIWQVARDVSIFSEDIWARSQGEPSTLASMRRSAATEQN